MTPIFLKPVFKEMIWGGNRLGTDFGYEIPGDDKNTFSYDSMGKVF